MPANIHEPIIFPWLPTYEFRCPCQFASSTLTICTIAATTSWEHPIRPPLVYYNRVTAAPSTNCIQLTELPASLAYTVTRLIYRANGCDRFVYYACARFLTSGQSNFPSIDSSYSALYSVNYCWLFVVHCDHRDQHLTYTLTEFGEYLFNKSTWFSRIG